MAYGSALLGGIPGLFLGKKTVGTMAGKLEGSLTRGLAKMFGTYQEEANPDAIARYMEGKEFQALGQELLGRGPDQAIVALTKIRRREQILRGKKPEGRSESEKAELSSLEGLEMARDFADMKSGKMNEEQLRKKWSVRGKSLKEVIQKARVVGANILQNEIGRFRETAQQVGKAGRARLDEMTKTGGLLKHGEKGLELRSDILKDIKGSGPGGKAFLEAMKAQTQVEASLTGTAGTEAEDQLAMKRGFSSAADMSRALGVMTVAQKTALIKGLRGKAGAAGIVASVGSSKRIQQGLIRAGKGAKGVAAMGGMFGLSTSKEQMKSIKAAFAKGGGGAQAAAEAMLEGTGIDIKSDAGKDLIKAIGLRREGKAGKAAELLKGGLGDKLSEAAATKRLSSDKNRNPTLAEISSKLDMLEKLDTLQAIAENTAKNGNAPPGEQKGKKPPP